MTNEQKFLLLAVLIVAGVGVTYFVTQSSSAPTPVEQAAVVVPKKVVKSYTAEVPYTVPAVPTEKIETVRVALTLTDGVITDITFTTNVPDNIASKENIDAFTEAFKSGADIKGKKLSEVSVVRLGGASLTSNAFMEAIGKIKTQSNG